MPRSRRPTEPEPQAALLLENQRLQVALERSEANRQDLRELVEGIIAAPWHPALFQRMIALPSGPRALVSTAGASRLVNVHPAIEAEALEAGDYVYLDHEQATIMAASDEDFVTPTETASFERVSRKGRIVARSQSDELILDPAANFDIDSIRAGQRVVFDRASRMALDVMEGTEGDQYQLEEVGDLKRDCVGGNRDTLDDLIGTLTAHLVEPKLARRYQLHDRRAILLHGPPGCGKTLMARVAASEIQRLSGKSCALAIVRPGEFESAYVGETEANIRNAFAALAAQVGDGLGLLFLDEVESIGRIRGGPGGRHSDRFLAALLAEMDGFAERGRISILAATNRRDLLDAALLSRLSDTQIAVPQPDRRAAQEIFGIHFSESLPYSHNASGPTSEHGSFESSQIRAELIKTVVARLYAPNAGNEICRLQLRDGTSRVVHARELISGRRIEQLALRTRENAFRRQMRNEGNGISIADGVLAIETALSELATTLSIHNAREYLHDLPQDIDVVRVESIQHQPTRRHRHYHAA
jgi:proteasome-associated ATPase